jgi:dTDP-4-dehydrorhamnose reductase
MRILILGGDGMLGHQLYRHFSREHEARVTLRQDLAVYQQLFPLFNERNAYAGIDVRSLERLVEVISDFRPEIVLNAIGIVKQRSTSKESIPSIEINALLPHRLAVLCSAIGARLIHYSTDCVFSGRKGNYQETDPSDAEDLYGKSKFLGEVHERHCITLRSSIIGRELSRKTSLFEWFLSQSGTVRGF